MGEGIPGAQAAFPSREINAAMTIFDMPWAVAVRQLAMALMLAMPALAMAEDVEVALDLYHFAGDLDAGQRDALLASPDWKVSASYKPVVSVPGITASWSKCGFLALPCLRDDAETITLTGSAIRRQGTELRFSLPHYVGVRRFRLDYVNISLRLPGQANHSELATYFYVDHQEGASVSPVILQADAFLLAGALSMQGESFRPRDYCPDQQECQEKSGSGRYVFRPRHRFAFYRQGYLFPGPAQPLRQPIPPELADKKIYRASLHTRQIDGHRIDFVDISAADKREDCFSNDLKYEIVYVDGEAISFSRRYPDPAQCRGRYQRIEWGNDGKPLAFGGMRVNWINHGSSVTYFDWKADCRSVAAGNHGACNLPAPTPAQQAEIRAEAKRVRGWFLSR